MINRKQIYSFQMEMFKPFNCVPKINMSSGSFKNVIYIRFTKNNFGIYIQQALKWNNLQVLIYHKTQTNQE